MIMLAAIQNLTEQYRDALVGYQELIEADIENADIGFDEFLSDYGITVEDVLEALGLDEDDIYSFYHDCEVRVGGLPHHYPVLVYRNTVDRDDAHELLIDYFPDICLECNPDEDDGKPAIFFLDDDATQLQFILEHISIIVLE